MEGNLESDMTVGCLDEPLATVSMGSFATRDFAGGIFACRRGCGSEYFGPDDLVSVFNLLRLRLGSLPVSLFTLSVSLSSSSDIIS